MYDKLHPDCVKALILGGLAAHDEELEKHVGKDVRFKDWKPSMGTATRDWSFKIIGVQKIFDGRIAYRVLCNDGQDNFGRPALPDQVCFVQ